MNKNQKEVRKQVTLKFQKIILDIRNIKCKDPEARVSVEDTVGRPAGQLRRRDQMRLEMKRGEEKVLKALWGIVLFSLHVMENQ